VAEPATVLHAGAHGHHRTGAQAAPEKSATEKSSSASELKKKVEPAEKRSAPAARAKKSTSSGVKKSRTRKQSANSKSASTK
jgi:hypothetical protein